MLRQCDVTTRTVELDGRTGRADAEAPLFRITAVEVHETRIVIRINDGAAVDWPLRRLAAVARAHPHARQRWELTPDGTGVNWPALSAPQPDGLLSVWEILEEQLYDDALGKGFDVGWNLDRLAVRDAELVALWRLTMDLVFGSYLQFRSSWGERTASIARQALVRVGAPEMARLLTSMDELADKHALPREVIAHAYLPALIAGSDTDRLQELEEAFWELAPGLPRLVVENYAASMRRGPGRTKAGRRGAFTDPAPRTAAS